MTRHLKWIAPLLVIATLLASCGSSQYAQNNRDYGRGRNDNWTLLGERRSDFRNGGDAIYPRGRYNNFSQLRFTTSGGNIHLYNATVVYDNGRRETYKLNMDNRNGGTRTISLRNRNSNIRQIELGYNFPRDGRRSGQGSILVYGR